MTSPAKSHPAGWFYLNIGIPPGPIVLLNLVAILWGSQHAVIKMCVSDVDPSSLSLVRFCLGALLATPAWWYSSRTLTTSVKGNMSGNTVSELFTTWRWGTEMGLWMFLGYAFQSIGLAVSTATCLCTYDQAASQSSLDTSTHFELQVYDGTTFRIPLILECQICSLLCISTLGSQNFSSNMGIGFHCFGRNSPLGL
jgi:hypothetical protein